MKESTIIILVVAGVAALFWAVQTGLIKVTGGAVNVGGGIVAPQPSQNYSGYLAASTAPGVSGALNAILGGVGSTLSSWLAPANANPAAPTPAQVAASVGPVPGSIQPTSATIGTQLVSPSFAGPSGPSLANLMPSYSATPIGPQTDASLNYDSTTGNAFDYNGLSGANAYDPAYSLMLS
jgi:hypothetical protein